MNGGGFASGNYRLRARALSEKAPSASRSRRAGTAQRRNRAPMDKGDRVSVHHGVNGGALVRPSARLRYRYFAQRLAECSRIREAIFGLPCHGSL
jgi:hypothetical protein